MSSFFAKYPKIQYDLFSDGSLFELTDISRSVIINTNKIQDDNALYTYYEIEDGERPDVVSHKLYGDTQYYWTFFIINDFLRDGYMSSWPLSYQNFNKMIEREYGKYSAVSIKPVLEPTIDLNGSGFLDISHIPLDTKYLPYLRLVSFDDKYRSSIAKYDAVRRQIIVYDCHAVDGTGKRIEISAETFIENTNFSYRIAYDDSMPDDYKQTWIDAIYSEIIKYDKVGYTEHIEAGTSKEKYISTKSLSISSPEYRWSVYSNAAYEYVHNDGNVLSAYDVLSNSDVVFPRYKSFYDYESEINDDKRVIQVIRPDFISDFSDEYFKVLSNTI